MEWHLQKVIRKKSISYQAEKKKKGRKRLSKNEGKTSKDYGVSFLG